MPVHYNWIPKNLLSKTGELNITELALNMILSF